MLAMINVCDNDNKRMANSLLIEVYICLFLICERENLNVLFL